MKYTLYIGENCHQCARVIAYINEKEISCKVINVDLEEASPPIPIFAFPALFEDENLLRYGSDIITFLDEQSSKSKI